VRVQALPFTFFNSLGANGFGKVFSMDRFMGNLQLWVVNQDIESWAQSTRQSHFRQVLHRATSGIPVLHAEDR
jgi:hypothetical protein